jgi:hypothetical protein
VVLAKRFDMSVHMLGGLSASELIRRTMREASSDDIFGLAAQLSYYFFLALFPAIHGKAPGEKSPTGRRVLGRRVRQLFEQRHSSTRPG